MRRKAGSILALVLAMSLNAASARAAVLHHAAASEADREAIGSCLRESGGTPRVCIGTIAVVCARQATGERREAEIDCSRREASVWRERLAAALAALGQRLEPDPRSRLNSVQRVWEDYSAQKCAFLADIHTPARVPGQQAACELRQVASRAIEVERLGRLQSNADVPPRPRLDR